MKEKEVIVAVLGEDIVKLLIKIGMYNKLLEGTLKCAKCNKKIDENNLMVITPKSNNQFEFICNDPGCFESFEGRRNKYD